MTQLDVELEMFLRALYACLDNPSPNTMFQLQRKAFHLRFVFQKHEQEVEKRITENVLKALSVKVETDDAIKKINALDKAIQNLGK